MIIFHHRINTLNLLEKVPVSDGVEVDIRSDSGDLILNHEPFERGTRLVDFLAALGPRPIILNVKEDGLETSILELLDRARVQEFFFLDQPFPTIVKMVKAGIPTSVRSSEFEIVPGNIPAEWLWLDCFNSEHWNKCAENWVRSSRKVCVVSPELQGRFSEANRAALGRIFLEMNYLPDAVCTKFPEWWRSFGS